MHNAFFTAAELAERDHFRELGIENVPYSIPWFKATGRPALIFGAGGATAWMSRQLFQGVNVIGLMDNNPELWGRERYGWRIFAPTEAFKKHSDAVAVVSMNFEPGLSNVTRQCRDLGFETVDWFDCRIRSDLRRYNENPEEATEVVAGLDIWDDNTSRETYRARVRFDASFRLDYLPPAQGDSEYFQDFAPPGAYRDFVDAGAFDGDTLREFLEFTRGDYDSYYAFEPVPDNLPALNIAADKDPRIRLTAAAVSDQSGSARMDFAEMGSAMSESGSLEVKTVSLDEELAGKKITCIKMDIEGAEPSALRGCVNIIREQRPVLAICVYHKPEHLWEIPLWIKDFDLDYRLHLRHYSNRSFDTICHAIP